jgi:CheY-like chemotaxis protein
MSQRGLLLVTRGEAAGQAARGAPAPRLLLVEDEAAIREPLGEVLQEEGFEVVTATNGREALDVLRHGPRPSAILLDLMMPVMDGWDFRHEQLTDPMLRDIRVLVLSAAGFSRETIRMQFGDVELIPKPVRYRELLEALDRTRRPAASAA